MQGVGDAEYDIAVVGGGPAGLTAALWLGRYLHSVVVIDSGDPRNWETREIHGFPGLPRVRPAELRGELREQCRCVGVTLVDGYVARARKLSADYFAIDYDPIAEPKARENRPGPGAPRAPEDNAPRPETRRTSARRLLLAYGLKDAWPHVSGLRQVYGAAAHVCPDCDGYETRGKKVCVIGTARKAVGLALDLATWTRDIVICTNGEDPAIDDSLCAKLDALNVPVLTEPIVRINARGEALYSIQFASGLELDCDHIFFKLGQRPADDLAAQLGCDRDDDDQVITDTRGHTSVHNVFAAGDIVPGPQLAIAAAGEGAIAALAIHKSLKPEALRLPKREERPGSMRA